uniref:Possible kynurenine formamidase n=1 Tax=Rheinheimera sp. BAL341 TaxID=1708203 RepID=A0A486XUA7_9GAMM
MIKKLILLKLALLLSACSHIATVPLTDKVLPTSPVSNVSYASLATQAGADNSITLHYGSEPLQFGRLYLPAMLTKDSKVPLLVFIHGGCWLNAYDLNHSTAFSQAVANAGIAVWSVEYRRVGDSGGGWPGSYHDVHKALQFAQYQLSSYPVDQRKLAIAGHSAGGQLALLAAANVAAEELRAVIGLAAITDLTLYAAGNNSCQRATSAFIGGSAAEFPGRYKLASPQGQRLHPSTLLLHGSSDRIVPLRQASESGINNQIIDDAGHFDWLHPQTQAFAQFLQKLQEQFAK